MIELVGRLVHLLTEKVESSQRLPPRFVREKLDVIAHTVRGEQTVHRPGGQQLSRDDIGEQGLGIVEELFGFWIVQDSRITAAQLPGMEKWRPINERHQFLEREVIQYPDTGKRRLGNICSLPFDRRSAPARLVDGKQQLLFFVPQMLLTKFLLFDLVLLEEPWFLLLAEEVADDSDRARCVQHMDDTW